MHRFLSRLLTTLTVVFTLSAPIRAQQLDSAKAAAMDAKLEEYFRAIELLPLEDKMAECDFLVESCGDSLLRNHVASYIYQHYSKPRIMGEEAVAIHMVDKWFESGKVKLNSDFELLGARMFAQFNRNSLLGMKAPLLTMEDSEGQKVSLPAEGRASVIYFYDVSCAKCKLTTIMLRQILESIDFPLDFYAVYTGVNHDEWDSYRKERWSLKTEAVNIYHLWDPEIDSNYQMEYGVIETPQMLLVDKDGIIIGRKLDADALSRLLESVRPYDYGSGETLSLFKMLFEEDGSDAEAILNAAAYMKKLALERKDSVLCKHLIGDLFYYLSDSQGEEYKKALLPFIEQHIEGDPALWSEAEDVAAIIAPAQMEKELLSRAPVGSRIAPLRVTGRLKTVRNAEQPLEEIKPRKIRLRALKGSPGWIVFHSPGCSSCAEVAAAAASILKESPDAKFLFVEPDKKLLDQFDLSVLPHIIEVDKKGNITRKYLTLK